MGSEIPRVGFTEFGEDPGRLKVLWIEDHAENLPLKSVAEAFWNKRVTVDWCDSPESAIDLYQNDENMEKPSPSQTYDLAHAPYDVIIADCKLDSPSDHSLAAEAPAAGLFTAVLAALKYPNYPVVIIPYSASRDEYESIWKLLQLVCPQSIHIFWEQNVLELENTLLRTLAREYRCALKKSLNEGIVYVSPSEARRLLQINKNGKIDAKELITLKTPWGQRSIRLTVLFFDKQGHGNLPADPIHKWIEENVQWSEEENRALELADEFWKMRESCQSQIIYLIAQLAQRGPNWKRQLEPYRSKESLKGKDWLANRESDASVQKLTMIFLIIRELAWRYEQSELQKELRKGSSAPLPDEKLLEIFRSGLREEEQEAESVPTELMHIFLNIRGFLVEYIGQCHRISSSFPTTNPPDMTARIEPAEFIPLVDPYPARFSGTGKTPWAELDWSASLKVRGHLDRQSWLKTDSLEIKSFEVIKYLLNPQSKQAKQYLSPRQLARARAYADSHNLPYEYRPKWLQE